MQGSGSDLFFGTGPTGSYGVSACACTRLVLIGRRIVRQRSQTSLSGASGWCAGKHTLVLVASGALSLGKQALVLSACVGHSLIKWPTFLHPSQIGLPSFVHLWVGLGFLTTGFCFLPKVAVSPCARSRRSYHSAVLSHSSIVVSNPGKLANVKSGERSCGAGAATTSCSVRKFDEGLSVGLTSQWLYIRFQVRWLGISVGGHLSSSRALLLGFGKAQVQTSMLECSRLL